MKVVNLGGFTVYEWICERLKDVLKDLVFMLCLHFMRNKPATMWIFTISI